MENPMSGPIQWPILVLGASGIVGRGVVRAALEAGQPVIAVDDDAPALARLAERLDNDLLTTLEGSVATDVASAALADALWGLGRPLAGVVDAVSGGLLRGRLLDQPSATVCRLLLASVQPHLSAARHLLPLMGDAGRGGTYVVIGGPGSTLPWSGYGQRSVAAAALRMLVQVLHDEARAFDVRMQLLSVDLPVCAGRPCANDGPQWPTALSIGQRALALVRRAQAPAETGPIVPLVAPATAAPDATAGRRSTEQWVTQLLQRIREATGATASRARHAGPPALAPPTAGDASVPGHPFPFLSPGDEVLR